MGPRRTRAHVIAAQSHNYIEKFFVDKGHTTDRPEEDYGLDLLVNTFDENGYAEGGDIRFQLKASDNLKYSKDGSYISFEIKVKHYYYWKTQPMPVFLVLYDAIKVKAYWLYVQAYFGSDDVQTPTKKTKTITVQVPVTNLFKPKTVDYMRKKKNEILEVEIKHEE